MTGVDSILQKNIYLNKVTVLHTPWAEVISNTENLNYKAVTINGTALKKPTSTGIIKLKTD